MLENQQRGRWAGGLVPILMVSGTQGGTAGRVAASKRVFNSALTFLLLHLEKAAGREDAPTESSVPVCRQPPHCVPETYLNATFWYKIFTTARDSNTKYSQDYNPFWCYKGAIGKVYHALNPKLTVIVPDVSPSAVMPLL